MTEKPGIRLLVVLLMASFAVVPILIYGCGPEWARWDAAQANQYFRLGETDDALYQLRDAISKSPRDPVIKLTLARRLVELGKPDEGLKLANEVLDLYPDNQPAMLEKAQCLQHMGDFDGALETWLKYDKMLNAFSRGVGTLNAVAYFRSLTGKDLNVARKDIEQAVAAVNRSISWKDDDGIRAPTKALVLSAMVARCCDATDPVLPELDRQIDLIQGQVDEFQAILLDQVYKEVSNFKTTSQIGIVRQQLREYERELAVLLTARALINQDAGKKQICNQDLDRIEKLGFDSAEIAQAMPEEQDVVSAISQCGALLDTRGYICSQLAWMDSETELRRLNEDRSLFNSSFESAHTDLKIALVCSQVHLKALDCQLSNSIDFYGDRETRKKDERHTIAVIRNHLVSLYSRAERQQEALAEEQQIREMGFEPGPGLF